MNKPLTKSSSDSELRIFSQSQSHFTTDDQSVSMSWCRAQSGTFDQRYLFIFFFLNYGLVLFGAPSLTRGRVCHLPGYSQSTVVSHYLHNLYTICVTHKSRVQ
jgi:hypothetical protein